MHQIGGKTVTSSDDGGTPNVLDPKNNKLHQDCSRLNEWIDHSSDATNTDVSHLVTGPSRKITSNQQKRCCRISTSSGYSSQSPPLSAISCNTAACCTNSAISKNSLLIPPRRSHNHHHHHHSTNRATGGSQNQQIIGPLAVIHEAETIPRPIWPCMGDDFPSTLRCEMIDCDVSTVLHSPNSTTIPQNHENSKQNIYNCCDYCRDCCTASYVYRDTSSCHETTTALSSSAAAASSARQVLLELSRTLNSVIETESDLTAEEILRDISITVARSINNNKPKDDEPVVTSSVMCEDYTYRLSSSSSSGGGKESSVGVNPVNLRLYGKPKWLHVPVSSRSSSQCPYEVKNLITAAQKASRTPIPAFGENPTTNHHHHHHQAQRDKTSPGSVVAPAVFLVPHHGNSIYPNSVNDCLAGDDSKITDCKGTRKQNIVSGNFDPGSKRIITTNAALGRLNGRPSENCGDKCPDGEPVYSTQLDGSDESSSYGAIGDSSSSAAAAAAAAKNEWNERSKVFDRHLDFTLDGNRAERLGRAIAKAKRKRQWCRGITAIFGLVFFVLSVVIVSLSVTRGRKVFGSM